MADQRAAVARVERETGLILAEAIACAARLPEAERDDALARLEERKAAFQQSMDALCDLLRQADPAAALRRQPEASTVTIVVNGISGPRCTVEASTEWTVRQVHEAIFEKIEVPVDWQKLLQGTEKLLREAKVGSLISEERVETLELTLVVEPPRPVNFVGMTNGLEQLEPGHLRETGGVRALGDATAVSSESLVVGQGRGLRFRPGTTNKDFIIGIGSRSSAPASFNEIDYAALCGYNGLFYVVKSGDPKFDGGAYAQTTEVVLVVHGDRVDFLLDGELQYSSQLRGETELYAMASFWNNGAEALEIQWL